MRKRLERFLFRHPRLYLRALQALGRGGLEKRTFLALLRSGDVICDIGANRGYFTRIFSGIVGQSGMVHAFEPGPWAFARLAETMAASGWPTNFKLHELALGDAPGMAVLNLPGNDDGQASLRAHELGSWANSPRVSRHECRLSTLDECAASFDRLDFVKCDVEGAELLVVKGARATLARLKPVLWLEVNPAWTQAFGYSPADVVSELRSLGYDTFRVVDAQIEPLSDESVARGGNLFCACAKQHAARLARLAWR